MGDGGYKDLSSKGQGKTGKRRALSKYELHMNASYEDQELKDNFRKAFEEHQAFSNGRMFVMVALGTALLCKLLEKKGNDMVIQKSKSAYSCAGITMGVLGVQYFKNLFVRNALSLLGETGVLLWYHRETQHNEVACCSTVHVCRKWQ
jgi:hypothetical protein